MVVTLLLLLLIANLARWVLQGAGGRGDRQLEGQHTAELARLREEVDQLTAHVLRLQDEQSFTMRLLSEGGERPPAAIPPADAAPQTPTTPTEMP
jgi:hypothetical protein